jgi:septum site-determining protein MinC
MIKRILSDFILVQSYLVAVMPDETVAIKGNRDGLLVSLNSTEEWLTVTSELAARIDEQSAFFEGATITVDLGPRPVPKYDLSGLKALLERRGLILSVVVSDSATTIDSANALDLRTGSSSDVPNESLPISPEETGTSGVLVRHTLRSGRTVHHNGHVIIYGDVNPGSEIVAGGDVFVWGRLRGNVHAGADGNEDAIVCALDMTPNQLRIADYITTSPTDHKRRDIHPEAAFIRDGQIVVESWRY